MKTWASGLESIPSSSLFTLLIRIRCAENDSHMIGVGPRCYKTEQLFSIYRSNMRAELITSPSKFLKTTFGEPVAFQTSSSCSHLKWLIDTKLWSLQLFQIHFFFFDKVQSIMWGLQAFHVRKLQTSEISILTILAGVGIDQSWGLDGIGLKYLCRQWCLWWVLVPGENSMQHFGQTV